MSNNDPKYDFKAGRIINEHTGEKIPENEPVMVFRAKDIHALPLLREYGRRAKDPAHQEAIQGRIDAFEEYARRNPSKMREPDTPRMEDSEVDTPYAEETNECSECGNPTENADMCDGCYEENMALDALEQETPEDEPDED